MGLPKQAGPQPMAFLLNLMVHFTVISNISLLIPEFASLK
jgi:hypothetical protein